VIPKQLSRFYSRISQTGFIFRCQIEKNRVVGGAESWWATTMSISAGALSHLGTKWAETDWAAVQRWGPRFAWWFWLLQVINPATGSHRFGTLRPPIRPPPGVRVPNRLLSLISGHSEWQVILHQLFKFNVLFAEPACRAKSEDAWPRSSHSRFSFRLFFEGVL